MKTPPAAIPRQLAFTPAWRRALGSGAALGVVILFVVLALCVLAPHRALQLLWFGFIPLAPMFLLAAPNVWVSLCPVSSVQGTARHLGWRGAGRLTPARTRQLQLAGWALLFVGVPSRHLLFNTDGSALFFATSAVMMLALLAGFRSLVLSGWCMGACPIRPVEVLYGQFALDHRRPTPCQSCAGCVTSCVRAKPEDGGSELGSSRLTSALAQAFPGFVASYFVLDLAGLCTSERAFFRGDVPAPANALAHASLVYAVMAAGTLLSLLFFHLLARVGVVRVTRLRLAAVLAYLAYYLGVAPEIAMAWGLDASLLPWLWIPPGLVLAAVLFLPRRRLAAS